MTKNRLSDHLKRLIDDVARRHHTDPLRVHRQVNTAFVGLECGGTMLLLTGFEHGD